MEELVETIKNVTVIVGAVTAILALISVALTMVDGLKCLMRSQMLQTYYHNKDKKQVRQYKDKKQVRQYEMQNFLALYKAYKAMKGNSFIEEIYQEVTSWEIIT